jgi:hypothetical protein
MTDTTDRELLEQALNDLEALVAYIKGGEPDLFMQVPSIEALRERLAQPDPLHPRLVSEQSGIESANFDWKGMAWIYRCPIDERYLPTPPQQREWQGLTNEEISAISKSIPGETDLGAAKRVFAREIEAKLKEKNT